MPGKGESATDIDAWTGEWAPPEGSLGLTFGEYLAELGRHWRWAAAHLSKGSKRQEFAIRRAATVPDCAKNWRVPVCQDCGSPLERKARPFNKCGSDGCPVCARHKANVWRKALFHYAEQHPRMRRKGKVSRDYYMFTFTIPKRETVSVHGLMQDVTRLFKGIKNVWGTVLQYHPRGKGKNEAAGMLAALDVGPHGNVHAHCIYYGGFHRAERIREAFRKKCPDAKWLKVEQVRMGRKGTGGLICEVAKYLIKTSVKAGYRPDKTADYTHPFLVMLLELALWHRRKLRAYGSMIGLKKAIDKERDESDDLEDAKLGETPCPCCGATSWALEDMCFREPWVPEGWAGGARAPPVVIVGPVYG